MQNHVCFTPNSGHQTTGCDVRFVPIADIPTVVTKTERPARGGLSPSVGVIARLSIFIASRGSFGLLRDVLGLLIALHHRSVVRRHVSIEATDLGRFGAVPSVVNFGQHSVRRGGNDTALDKTGE